MQRDEQLARLKRVAAGTDTEVFSRDFPNAGGSGDAASGAKSDQDRHGIGAGRGVAQVAADRSAALNLDAADEGGDVGESRIDLCDRGVSIDSIAGNGGAEREAVLRVVVDLVQLGDALEVDHEAGGLASRPPLDQQVCAPGKQ